MANFFSFTRAAHICIVIYIAMLMFHFALIVGAGLLDVIPTKIVWGGRLASQIQLVLFEAIALVITAACLFFTLIKAGYLPISPLRRVSHFAMWVMFVYFLFNTVGNLAAPTVIEKSMSLVAALLSVSSLRMALEKS
ncbi:MAG: hypothetical protein JXR76_15655 [Deltaproteobacteria bacterium]|nr:hypothetical protein [Deltaproteobacteria bacterium]